MGLKNFSKRTGWFDCDRTRKNMGYTPAAVNCAIFFTFPKSAENSPRDSGPCQGCPYPTVEKSSALNGYNLFQSNILIVICHTCTYTTTISFYMKWQSVLIKEANEHTN